MASNKATILVVDDEKSSREMLEMAIQGWGYDVCLAHDGVEAISVFSERSPSLVISDVVMPRLDGLGLLQTLKSISPDTPVILITAYGTINDALVAMRHGAVDFLTKPIDYSKLKRLVEQSLPEPEEGKVPSRGAQVKSRITFSSFQFWLPPTRIAFLPKAHSALSTAAPQTGNLTLPGGRFRGPGSCLAEC